MPRYEYHLVLNSLGPKEAAGILEDLRRLFGKKNVGWDERGHVTIVTSLNSGAALDAIRLFVRKHPNISVASGVKLEE